MKVEPDRNGHLPTSWGRSRSLAGRQQWVAEGIYLGWTEALLDRATDIVWLDVPWRVAAWRIVRRHAQASRRGTNQHRGLGNLWNFLRSARQYYKGRAVVRAELDDDGQVTRAETKRALAGRQSKVIRCSSNKKIERFLDTVPKVV